jgi:hypothetical protein
MFCKNERNEKKTHHQSATVKNAVYDLEGSERGSSVSS